jgi:hypothetical protein
MSVGAEPPQGGAGDQMGLDVEGVIDRGVAGEEALGLALALEFEYFPLSSSDLQMGVFHPVVLTHTAGAKNPVYAQSLVRGMGFLMKAKYPGL